MTEHKTVGLGQPRSGARLILAALFGLTFLAALLPPVYIEMTKLHDVVIGLPVSVWYLFLVSGAAVALCAVLYAYESARGELD